MGLLDQFYSRVKSLPQQVQALPSLLQQFHPPAMPKVNIPKIQLPKVNIPSVQQQINNGRQGIQQAVSNAANAVRNTIQKNQQQVRAQRAAAPKINYGQVINQAKQTITQAVQKNQQTNRQKRIDAPKINYPEPVKSFMNSVEQTVKEAPLGQLLQGNPKGAVKSFKSALVNIGNQITDPNHPENAALMFSGEGGGAFNNEGVARTINPKLFASYLEKQGIPAKVGHILDVAKAKLPEYSEGQISRAQVEAVKEQIRNGMPINPLVLDEAGNVLDGAHRLTALKEMGVKGVQTVIQKAKQIPGEIGQLGQQVEQKLVPTTMEQLATKANPLSETSTANIPQQLNVNRLNLSQFGKENVRNIDLQNSDKVKQVLSNKQITDIAKNVGLDTKTHSIDDTANIIANHLNVRNTVVSLENQFENLKKTGADPTQLEAITKQIAEHSKVAREQGTDIARQLQARRIIANELDTPMQKVFKLLDNAGVNPDVYATKAAHIDWNDSNQVASFYRQLVPAKAKDWIDAIRYNSMLSSPLTHIVNVSSNLMGSGFVAPVEKTLTGTLDFINPVRRIMGKPQTQFAGEGAAYMGGYVSNVSKAFKNFASVLSNKKTIENLDTERMPLATGKFGKAVANTLEFPTKLLEGADQFFTALTQGGEEAALKFKGSRGVNVGNIAGQAEEAAKYRLFRQKLHPAGQGDLLNGVDELTNKIMQLRNSKVGWVRTIADFTLPFVQTPMNIFKQGLEYSPAGIASIPGSANKTAQLSKAIMGTTTAAAAASLLGSGRLTWSEPTDPTQKAAFRESGMQPYSVKVGDKWVSYQKLHPAVSFNLALISALDDMKKSGQADQGFVDSVLTGVAKYGSFLSDQTYFKNIGDIVNLAKGDKESYARLISNYPQQLVPFRALGGWLARMSDQYQRQPDKNASFLENQVQQLMQNIPGLSQKLPARLDTNGNPLPNQNKILNSFSPVKVTSENPTGKQNYLDLLGISKLRKEGLAGSAENKKNVEDTFNEIQNASDPNQKKALFQQALNDGRINEDNVDQYMKLVTGSSLPTTASEKSLRGLPTQQKASFIIDKIKQLPDKQSKAKYLEDLVSKGIISNDTIDEIINQANQPPLVSPQSKQQLGLLNSFVPQAQASEGVPANAPKNYAPYHQTVVQAATKNGIPPEILAAALARESANFDPKYVNGYHVDKTGRGIAGIDKKYHPEVTDAQAFDPNFAINWMANELGRILKKNGGNVYNALREYNGGASYAANTPGYQGRSKASLTKRHADTIISQSSQFK